MLNANALRLLSELAAEPERTQKKVERRYSLWGRIIGKTAHHWECIRSTDECDYYACTRCNARRMAGSIADAPKGGFCGDK